MFQLVHMGDYMLKEVFEVLKNVDASLYMAISNT